MALSPPQSPLGKIPSSIGKFFTDIYDFLKPSSTNANVPPLARRFNEVLTGKTHEGKTSYVGMAAKIVLSVAFIATVATVAKNWLQNRFTKDKIETHNSAAEELRLRTETDQLRMQTQYMLETGTPLPQVAEENYLNPEARGGYRDYLAKREMQQKMLATEGAQRY